MAILNDNLWAGLRHTFKPLMVITLNSWLRLMLPSRQGLPNTTRVGESYFL